MTVWTRETAERRLAELAPAVARALGRGWRHDKRDREPTHYTALVRGDERVGLHVGSPYGRLNISGSLKQLKDSRGENPCYPTEDNPSITTSLDRTPVQVARDIERQVLPGYRAILAKAIEVVRQRNKHFALTAESAAAIARVVGATEIDDRLRVSFYRAKKLPGLDGDCTCDGERAALHLPDLSVAEAGAALATLVLMRTEGKP